MSINTYKINILYISDYFLNLSVFKSQVHTLCNYHAQQNPITLLTMCNIKEIWGPYQCQNYQYTPIKTFRFPKTVIPFSNKLSTYFFNQKHILENCDIIHCRGHIGAAFGLNLLRKYDIKKPLIADIRGAVVEELAEENPWLANQAKKTEQFVFDNASHFFFVSKKMQEYYSNKYQIPASKSSIFPGIIDERLFYKSQNLREQTRNQLNIQNKIVYIYTGKLYYWQNAEEIFKNFAQAQKNNPNLFFLILTQDLDQAKEYKNKYQIPNTAIKILSVSYEEVGKYLNAADIGIVNRTQTKLIDQVAAPIKIHEYLTCGLKIINNAEDIGNLNKNFDAQKYYEFKNIKQTVSEQLEVYKKLIK